METAGVVAGDSLNNVPDAQKKWVRRIIPGGYVLEFAIKWSAISSGIETITPIVGNVFGLAINQHDNDGSGHKATVQWAAVLSNEVWSTSKYLGTVKFLANNKLQFIPTNNMTGVTNLIPYDGSDILLAPDKPVLSAPATGSTNQALNPALTWNTANRAASYTLQVSTASNFSNTVVNQSGITSTNKTMNGLANNTKYYWRVMATNAGGTSNWSNTWNFTTKSNVGFDETGENTDYLIYPNPTDGIITIESSTPNCSITLFSVDGKPIVKNALVEGANSFDLTDLTSGIYILKLTDNHGIQIMKIIKN
jgi:hypothetical protein